MKEINTKMVIMLKYGELILKGLNRSYFEGLLMKDIRTRLEKYGYFKVEKAQSTIYVSPEDDASKKNFDKAFIECKKVFGIASVCKAYVAEKNMENILSLLPSCTKEALSKASTFKVEAKRSDKAFPLKSPEICNESGGILLNAFPHLKVDVNNPDVTVKVEIRDFAAYIHCGAEEGAGGMPLSSSGKSILLLSGGIDSPVAGYMMARRGVTIEALHFESFPYTSEKAREKVIELASIMTDYCGSINLHIISVTHIQEEIKRKCREEYFTLILRRFMMKLAEMTAKSFNCKSIITGESLGQVASQTMGALGITNSAVSDIPVFRPLIAFDKEEIVKIARKIGTFDTSILPYEDCCTVFTPKHPVTNPILLNIISEEGKLNIQELLASAFETRNTVKL